MRGPALKVYGYLEPVPEALYVAVKNALTAGFVPEDALLYSPPCLSFAYEGEYFPLEDVLACIEPMLDGSARGKLDYIDMEAWQLTRHFFQNGHIVVRSAGLNHVMDSCQK